MIRIVTFIVLASIAGISVTAVEANARERRGSAPARYYDQYGQDRGYEWCFRRGRDNSSDCNYYTRQQCQATAQGLIGYCERNPWAINPRG